MLFGRTCLAKKTEKKEWKQEGPIAYISLWCSHATPPEQMMLALPKSQSCGLSYNKDSQTYTNRLVLLTQLSMER